MQVKQWAADMRESEQTWQSGDNVKSKTCYDILFGDRINDKKTKAGRVEDSEQ